MEKVYYAIFYPLDDGGWGVRFPDAESVNSQGATLEDALFMAIDALSGILVIGRKGREYHDPSSFKDVESLAGTDELVLPVIPKPEIMDEYRPKKRVNVMVFADLLDRVDSYVNKTPGLNRLKFFCLAAEDKLEHVS